MSWNNLPFNLVNSQLLPLYPTCSHKTVLIPDQTKGKRFYPRKSFSYWFLCYETAKFWLRFVNIIMFSQIKCWRKREIKRTFLKGFEPRSIRLNLLLQNLNEKRLIAKKKLKKVFLQFFWMPNKCYLWVRENVGLGPGPKRISSGFDLRRLFIRRVPFREMASVAIRQIGRRLKQKKATRPLKLKFWAFTLYKVFCAWIKV